jgi:hypothetical protein
LKNSAVVDTPKATRARGLLGAQYLVGQAVKTKQAPAYRIVQWRGFKVLPVNFRPREVEGELEVTKERFCRKKNKVGK